MRRKRNRSNGWKHTRWARNLKSSPTQCYYCKRVLKRRKDMTYEHIIPISLGGRSIKSNVTISCSFCNGLKGGSLVNSTILSKLKLNGLK